MAKRIVFLAEAKQAAAAKAAFETTAGLFRSQFECRCHDPAKASEIGPGAAEAIVVFDPAFAAAMAAAPVHVWKDGDFAAQATQLLAVLLGGGAPYVAPPPVPVAAPKPGSLGTAKVSRETAGRRGKGVTVISDLKLSEEKLKDLATALKSKCGSGGTAKDGRIEIQGDHRDAVQAELERLGYKVKRSGG